MEKLLMFWALVNLAVSLANAVNLRKLRLAQQAIDEQLEPEGDADE